VAVLRAIGALLGFVFTIILGRTLGPAGLGAYAYAVTFVVVVAVPISNGWGTVLLKSTTTGHFDGNWGATQGLAIRGAQFAFLLVGILFALYLFLLLSAPNALLSIGITPWTIVVLASILLLDQLSGLRIAILRGLDHPFIAQAPELLVRPVALAITFLLLVWWQDGQGILMHAFVALFIAALLNTATGYVLMWWKAPPGLQAASPQFATRSWLASARPITLSSGLIVLNAYIDILILGAFVDASDIGIYRVAVQVSVVSGLAYTSLNLLASQRFALYRAAGDFSGAQATATLMSRVALSFSILLPVVLIFAGNEIVPFVFGEAFALAVGPMIVLALGQCISAATGVTQPLLLMNGLEKRVMMWTLVSVLANVFLCLIFIPRFGVMGAACSTVLAATVWNIGLWSAARKQTGIDTSFLAMPKKGGQED
jgi:O-antigen/teichoic acid export membrane protein